MPTEAPHILKVCGLRSLAHMRVAEACGATHVGVIVEVARSRRSVDRHQARLLARAARARPVMVTTAEDLDEIVDLARTVQPHVVQLHTERPPSMDALREALPGVEFWQVVSVEIGGRPDLEAPLAHLRSAAASGAEAIVLDAARGGQSGGIGAAMDWAAAAHLVAKAGRVPVILAGGLSPANVGEAVREVRPAGVDVSSGVESAPNAKSPALIRSFCEAVRQVTAPQEAPKSTEPSGGGNRSCR